MMWKGVLAPLFHTAGTHALSHGWHARSFTRVEPDDGNISAIVAIQKSHSQPSVEMGMKNVDKNIDKRNKQ